MPIFPSMDVSLATVTNALTRVVLSAVPLMLGVICHEIAHGMAALKLGDPTAKNAGRLTFNPIKHLDKTGSMVFLITALFSPVVFGWAKPVPVDPRYFKDPQKGMIWVSLAGPMTNLALAVGFAALFHGLLIAFGQVPSGSLAAMVVTPLVLIAQLGVVINLVLCCLNLIPVPPLDGSNILAGLLPLPLARRYLSIGPYGMLIIILLLALNIFDYTIGPVVFGLTDLLLGF